MPGDMGGAAGAGAEERAPGVAARRITVTGRVQGVGYRPFVYRTAHELGLTGWVLNGAGKAYIHAEGPAERLDGFETALVEKAPPLARPRLALSRAVPAESAASFDIRASEGAARSEIHIPPDLFTCDDCLDELSGPDQRRYRYPFINCTQCGPRYTIIRAMPYDRANTSMEAFPLCAPCRGEYADPLDRRFHAQPLACPECGPELELRIGQRRIPGTQLALVGTIDALREGRIVAVKGVGGYHLMCDAANDEAVRALRRRKHRPHKPLAVMFPIEGPAGLESRARARPHPDAGPSRGSRPLRRSREDRVPGLAPGNAADRRGMVFFPKGGTLADPAATPGVFRAGQRGNARWTAMAELQG